MDIKIFHFESHEIRVVDAGQGVEVVALDIVKAIGMTNASSATSTIAAADKRLIDAPIAAQPSRRLKVLNSAGVLSLLRSKATPVAQRCLAWAETELLQSFATEESDDNDPIVVHQAIQTMATANVPWTTLNVTYEGHSLEQDPRTVGIWATQRQIADIYGTSVQNVSKHITTIYAKGDLSPSATINFQCVVANEGGRSVERQLIFYNFDVISAVGDRVSSQKAKAFRAWRARLVEDHLLKVKSDNDFLRHEIDYLKKQNTYHNRIQAETDDEVFEARLSKNLDPFTGEPLKTRAAVIAATIKMKTHQRQLHNFLLIAAGVEPRNWEGEWDPITVDTVIRKCPSLFERDPNTWPRWPEQNRASQPTGGFEAPKGKNVANDDPDKELRAARKLASEIACMDLCAASQLEKAMKIWRPEFSNFKAIAIAGWATGLLALDADRCADPERYEIGTEMARLAIDAGIAKGQRYIVTTNVDEILADWTAWIGEDAKRKNHVVAMVNPDPKLRAEWAARLAQALQDDGETKH